MTQFDLIVTGGVLLDPAQGIHEPRDIGIKGGRVAAIEASLETAAAAERIDAAGLLVTPGLVDLHTHVYPHATPLGVDPDQLAWRTGVTTWIDAGTAGAATYAGLAEHVASRSRARILAFINLSKIGLVAPGCEFNDLRHPDVELCARSARRYPSLTVGVKARIDRDTVGQHGLEPVRRARQAADELGLPLMVHIGHGPPAVQDVLGFLQTGDVLTHAFTGLSMRVVDEDGRPLQELVAARERGVLLDIGHGMGSLSFETAEAMLAAGIGPDTISSDTYLHAARSAMVDLQTCMSKFLALGMSLEEVVDATTRRPAEAIGRPELGTLAVGAEADLAIFELEQGRFEFYDSFHQPLAGTQRLRNRVTLRAGARLRPAVAEGPWDQPGTDAWQELDDRVDRELREAGSLPPEQLPAGLGTPELPR